jgi:hypothetical protein
MNGLFPIIDFEEQFHYQKSGNSGEWKKYVIHAPTDTAISFTFTDHNFGTITQFEARKIDNPVGTNDPDILSVTDMIPLDPIIDLGNGRFQQTATENIGELEEGLYYYYITDGVKEKKSELFCISGDIERTIFLENNLQELLEDNTNDKIYTLK